MARRAGQSVSPSAKSLRHSTSGSAGWHARSGRDGGAGGDGDNAKEAGEINAETNALWPRGVGGLDHEECQPGEVHRLLQPEGLVAPQAVRNGNVAFLVEPRAVDFGRAGPTVAEEGEEEEEEEEEEEKGRKYSRK